MPQTIINHTVNHTVDLTLADQTPGLPMGVTAGGTIFGTGTTPAIYGTSAAAWTVINQGLVSGDIAVGLEDGGVAGSIDNLGTLTATYLAVDMAGTGQVTNRGLISSNDDGIRDYSAAGITNASTGIIAGAATGIVVLAALTLSNQGVISTQGIFSATNGGRFCAAVYDQGGTVTNGGLIDAAQWAIYASAATSMVNTGTITAATQSAVDLTRGGTVTNAGTIAGPVAITGGRRLVVNNDGTISGTQSGISLNGYLAIDNGGTIAATAGPAIAIGSGIAFIDNDGILSGTPDVLVASGGARVTLVEHAVSPLGGGTIDGTGASVTVELPLDPAPGTLDLGGLVNAGIVVDQGAPWNLPGTLSLFGNTAITVSPTTSLAGSGTIVLSSGSTLALSGAALPTFEFQPAATLDLLTPGAKLTPLDKLGVLANFAATDFIDLTGLATAAVTTQGNRLDITPAGGTTFQLEFAPGTNMSALTTTPDIHGNLVIGHS